MVFVTGRPFRWLDPVRSAFGQLGTVICSNGALVYDLEAERVLEAKTLDTDAVLEVRQLILAREPGAVFAAETTQQLYLEPGFVEPDGLSRLDAAAFRPFSAANLAGEGVVKLLAKTHAHTAEAFLDLVRPDIAHLVSVTHSAPDAALLEMARPDVNKAAALQVHARALGVDAAEVVAFGDMPNDVEMLAWAGRGCAVGSGHALARAAAAEVVGSLQDDGVARVIEELLAAGAAHG